MDFCQIVCLRGQLRLTRTEKSILKLSLKYSCLALACQILQGGRFLQALIFRSNFLGETFRISINIK